MSQHGKPATVGFSLARLGRVALPALLLLISVAGCGQPGAPPANDPYASPGAAAEWKWLRAHQQKLDERRAQLAQARAQGKSAAGGKPSPALAALEREVAVRDDELERRLVDFINAHPPREGEALRGRQLEAVRMKSDEDMLHARELIEQGGDYRRALDLYESALAVDPDNPRLRQELAAAQARRYVTAEHFAQVKKGMTQDEVRALLGQPNLNNVRDYPQRGITAWFYTKGADGSAAAVWFEKQRGLDVVYALDFHSVEPGRIAAPAPGERKAPA